MDLGVRYEVLGVPVVTFAPVMGLSVGYEVVGVVGEFFVLSDSVELGLSDVWGWGVGFNLDLSDSVGLSLFDGWILLMDVVSLVRFVDLDPRYPAVVDVVDLVGSAGLLGMYGVSDSVSLRLFDRMGLLVDEISLVEFVGLGVGYTAVITVDGVVITEISTRVSYPAVVDVIDLVVGAGVSVG
jgi:hypothetical protein